MFKSFQQSLFVKKVFLLCIQPFNKGFISYKKLSQYSWQWKIHLSLNFEESPCRPFAKFPTNEKGKIWKASWLLCQSARQKASRYKCNSFLILSNFLHRLPSSTPSQMILEVYLQKCKMIKMKEATESSLSGCGWEMPSCQATVLISPGSFFHSIAMLDNQSKTKSIIV